MRAPQQGDDEAAATAAQAKRLADRQRRRPLNTVSELPGAVSKQMALPGVNADGVLHHLLAALWMLVAENPANAAFLIAHNGLPLLVTVANLRRAK